MYPDIEDVKSASRKILGRGLLPAEKFWPAAVLVAEWLDYAFVNCRNFGRWKLVPAHLIKKRAEAFIGTVSEYEFTLGVLLQTRIRTITQIRDHVVKSCPPIDVMAFDSLMLHFPPTDRLLSDDGYQSHWKQFQVRAEEEITREKQTMRDEFRSEQKHFAGS